MDLSAFDAGKGNFVDVWIFRHRCRTCSLAESGDGIDTARRLPASAISSPTPVACHGGDPSDVFIDQPIPRV